MQKKRQTHSATRKITSFNMLFVPVFRGYTQQNTSAYHLCKLLQTSTDN